MYQTDSFCTTDGFNTTIEMRFHSGPVISSCLADTVLTCAGVHSFRELFHQILKNGTTEASKF